jgi:MYXO-CTERM domain-containing protein
VNPATGAVTVIGATGLGGYALCTAVLGGTVYATDFYGNLYTVNKMTGAASLIGYTGIPSVPAYQKILGSNLGDDESFFGINGKLYATFDVFNISTEKAVFGPELYEINPTTGVATILGSTSLYIDSVAEVDGTVYAFNLADQELSLDLATGKTTFVRDYDPAAFFITGAAPSPEPVSLGLAGLGMLALLIFRRRRAATAREPHGLPISSRDPDPDRAATVKERQRPVEFQPALQRSGNSHPRATQSRLKGETA